MSDHTGATLPTPDVNSLNGHVPQPWSATTPAWVHTSATPLQTAIAGLGQGHIGPAATLWPVGQDSDTAQRDGRYLPHTLEHPQRTLPALAAHAINRYSYPGQTVFDPFVGCGTTVVEAMRAGRRGIGVDIDPRWTELTELNITHARRHGATGKALVRRADARSMPPVTRRWRGIVDLVMATPPHRLHPSRDPARNWSNADLVRQLETDLKLCLTNWIPLLHPGTTVILVSRLLPRGHQLLDLTVPIAYAAGWAGLTLLDRAAALRTPIRDTHHPRPTTRKRSTRTLPRVIHDDVLIYQVPDVLPTWWRSRQ